MVAPRPIELEPTESGGRHLLALRGLGAEALRELLALTGKMLGHSAHPSAPLDTLTGRTVATVFFEPSTRTRGSFALAAQRLGAGVVDFSNSNSTSKGESLADTVRTVAAMGVDAIVIRSSSSGAAACASKVSDVPILNAGDGQHEHPTQGLLDAYALCEALERAERFDLTDVRVAIVGDVLHSRVARSSVAALTALGASVELVGPEPLVPRSLEALGGDGNGGGVGGGVTIEREMGAAIERADAVMMLRVQFERGARVADLYRQRYALTVERAQQL